MKPYGIPATVWRTGAAVVVGAQFPTAYMALGLHGWVLGKRRSQVGGTHRSSGKGCGTQCRSAWCHTNGRVWRRSSGVWVSCRAVAATEMGTAGCHTKARECLQSTRHHFRRHHFVLTLHQDRFLRWRDRQRCQQAIPKQTVPAPLLWTHHPDRCLCSAPA